MALFKILKGNEANLPSDKHEGWAYVTEKGNMYVDLSNDTRVKVGNRADTAEFADKATGDTKSIRDIYLAKLAQVESTGSKFTFRGITGGGDNAPDLISIPLAGDLAGLVSNAAQTIKGNKTFFDGISFPTIGTWPAVAGETYPIKSKGLNWSGSSDNGSIFYEVQATDKGMIIIQSGDDTGAGTIFRNSSSGNEVSIINGLVTGTFQGNLTGTASHATSDANGNNIAATYVADVSKKKNSDGSIASHYVFRVTKGDGTYNDVDLHFAASASCGGAANSALTVGQGNDPNTAFDANAITVAQSKKTFYATNTDKMTNRPSGTHWGYLDAGAYSSSYMTQTFTDGTNANTYIRVKNNTWGDWKQFAFTDGTIQNAQYAEKDKEGNIIADTYIATLQKDTSDGTTFSFKGVSANGDARPDTISIPAATASIAGLVTTGTQTWTGAKTLDSKGSLVISKAAGFNYTGIETASAAQYRDVWFADSARVGTPVHNSKFQYNPACTDKWASYDTTTPAAYGSLKADRFTGIAQYATKDVSGNLITSYIKSVALKSGSNYIIEVITGNGDPTEVKPYFAASSSCGGDANQAIKTKDLGNHTEAASGTTANAPSTGMLYASGMYMTRTYTDSNTPTNYGNIINVAGAGTGQLLLGWSGTDSTTGNIYYRSHRDTNTGGWGAWKQLVYTDGTVANAQYAEKDKEGNVIADSYVSTIVQDSSTGTAFSFKGVSANGDARPDIISIPAATATVAGLVTNAAQTFAGVKTFKNNIDVKGKVIIDLNGNKVEIGSNNKSYFHFLVRNQATTPLTFWFGGPIQTAGKITPYGHDTYDLGSSGSRWKTGYFGSGGINVSGTITDKESNELKASLFVNTLIASTSSGNSFIIGGKNTAGDEITTLAIPNASATSVGLVTNEAQTFGGHKTFNNNVYGDFRSLMADAVGGHLLYTDPTFMIGSNSVVVYNNASNGNVVHERITRPSDCPSVSDYVIKITTKGTASPGYGGFYQTLTSRAGAQFVIKYLIKLPVGYKLVTATNSMGSGYVDKIISDNAGTGQWKIYTRYVKCGTSGSFSSGGHLYVANNGGAAPSASAPLVWYLGGIWAYDITRTGINSDINHIYPNFDSQQLTIHGKLKVEDKIFDSAGSEIKASLFVNTIAQNAISGTAYSIKGVNTEGDSITTLSLPIASTSQCGLITNAAQTLKGDKTLQGKLIVSDSNTSATTKSSILQLTSSSNGNVGMEFWRGTNASWQIINSGGDLIFRNNYKDNAESAYNHQSLKLNYGTGAGSIPYLGINGEDTGYRLYVNGTTYIESDTSINSGALKFDSSPTSAPEASVPTALSLGRLQGYGTFAINADTDGTKTEYLVLTSGRGITSTTSHGLAIGYDTISWLGNSLWTKYLMKTVMIDASSLNVDTWYPVVIPLPYENCRIEIECSLNTNKPSWSTHDRGFTARKVWESNGSGWGTTSVIRRVLVSTYKFCDTDPIRGIGQLTNSSLEYVYVRGGGKYRFKVSANVTGTVELVTASKTWSSQSIAPTTTAPSTILCPYLYTTVQRGSAYRLAYYDSAQNLNSTGHYASSSQIGINITDIATIGDYALYTNGTSNFADTIYIRPCRGNYCEGLRIYQYGSWSDILLGGNDLTANTGTSANSWFIGNNNGTLNITRNGSSTGTAYLRCVSNKWYINTTSGAEQLNIGGWVGTVGNSGWYSITHGGGWYMNDANFIRNYGSKAVSINIADKNSWGIGTHRLAAVFKGTNHVSILLSTDTLGYGLCVNNNGNWYWGKRDSNSETATSKDTYLLQGNTTLVRPSTDMAIGLGQVKSAEFSNAYIRAINARHLDASGVYDGDMNLYIGYGSNSPTQKTSFYYSSGTHGAAATSRTQFAEINSNGLYALTRFGVNGQSTDYNFYVNGSSYLSGNANVCKVYNSSNYNSNSSLTLTQLAAYNNASCGMIYAATDNPRGAAGWVHVWSQAWSHGVTSSWVSQIALNVADGAGMWYRTTSGNIAGKAWIRILDTNNYASVLDSRYVNVTGDTMTGLLTVTTGSSHGGIKMGDTYVTSISGNVIFQNNNAIRFGTDSWDYNCWAGLKYNHSNKTVYLGLADGSIFTANTAQSGGTVALPGIRYLSINGKIAIDANDAWLRINEGKAFSSGIYFGSNVVRTDGQFQVGSGGANFYANSSGNGYFSNTLGIGATNTNYALNVYGTTKMLAKTDFVLASATAIGTTPGTLHLATNGVGSGTAVTDGTVSSLTFGAGNVAYAGIYSPSSGDYGNHLIFATTDSYADGAKSRMTITAAGNVGIGTTAPSHKLHVSGTGYISTRLGVGQSNSNYTFFVRGISAVCEPTVYAFQMNASSYLIPPYPGTLHVSSPTVNSVSNTAGIGCSSSGITFGHTSPTTGAFAGIYSTYTSALGSNLIFATTNSLGSGTYNRMTITPRGTVCINIPYASPSYKLYVVGNAYVKGTLTGTKVVGAVWNDYAEYRRSNKEIQPGRTVIETGKGDLVLATERLQPGANIVSDTFGFAIGETEKTKTPIAVSGRALAYPYEDISTYKAGDPVCTGPNGTISKMTREEVQQYPDRIVGTVSEIPEYDEWGTGNVKVNGRIWIKVR